MECLTHLCAALTLNTGLLTVAYLEFHKGGKRSPPSPLPPSLPFSSPPLEVEPLNPARGSGDRCKLT